MQPRGGNRCTLISRAAALLPLTFVIVALPPSAAGAAPVTIYDLGTLGGPTSFGYAINGSRQATGFSRTASSTANRAFLYSGTPGSGGSMRDLGTLGGSTAQGTAINAGGMMTGASAIAGDAANRAFLYTGVPGSGGRMDDLGALPGGTSSNGGDINDGGQVVGSAQVDP